MSVTVRWQLDLPVQRAQELDAFVKTYGFTTRKDLVNTALAMMQWAVDEVKSGRAIASIDEANGRYKELVVPAFEIAAAQALAAHHPLAAAVSELEEVAALLAQTPGEHGEVLEKIKQALDAASKASASKK